MDAYIMILTAITMTMLEAAEGMMLTDGESYGKTVYLGANDSAENWREVTEAEYEALTQEAAEKDGEADGGWEHDG